MEFLCAYITDLNFEYGSNGGFFLTFQKASVPAKKINSQTQITRIDPVSGQIYYWKGFKGEIHGTPNFHRT